MKPALFSVLFVMGPVIAAMVPIISLRKRLPLPKRLFISGIINLILYLTLVAIPYYFQGYKDITEHGGAKPFGLPAVPLLGDFAYVYTTQAMGFAWLIAGLIQTVAGDLSAQRAVNLFLKIPPCIAFASLLFEFHNFHATINAVLE
jgi:hypothetical protein